MSRILLYSKVILFLWEDFHWCSLFVLYKSVFLQVYILVLYRASKLHEKTQCFSCPYQALAKSVWNG